MMFLLLSLEVILSVDKWSHLQGLLSMMLLLLLEVVSVLLKPKDLLIPVQLLLILNKIVVN